MEGNKDSYEHVLRTMAANQCIIYWSWNKEFHFSQIPEKLCSFDRLVEEVIKESYKITSMVITEYDEKGNCMHGFIVALAPENGTLHTNIPERAVERLKKMIATETPRGANHSIDYLVEELMGLEKELRNVKIKGEEAPIRAQAAQVLKDIMHRFAILEELKGRDLQ